MAIWNRARRVFLWLEMRIRESYYIYLPRRCGSADVLAGIGLIVFRMRCGVRKERSFICMVSILQDLIKRMPV